MPDSLYKVVKEYQSAFTSGNTAKCKTLLTNNPDLAKCMWKAIDYNWLRDAVLAMETLYLEDIEKKIAQKVGINDDMLPTNANAGKNTWSLKKINSILTTKYSTTISTGDWADNSSGTTYPYVATKTITGIVSGKDYELFLNIGSSTNNTNAKEIMKSFGYICRGVSKDGSMEFYAYKKPSKNIPVYLREV